MKTCTKCGIEKSKEEFHKRTYKTGFVSVSHNCKSCIKEKSSKRYLEKSEHINSVNKEWRAKNKDYYHNRFLENREEYLSWLREHNKNNPDKRLERTRKRRVRNKEAFVSWANRDSVNSIYAMSKFLTDVVGVQYHVDHVIPLQGKLVSGLHVETNLAIIRSDINLRKGNKYET